MIKRYADKLIDELNGLSAKFTRWQEVELAVIEASESLGLIPEGIHAEIKTILESHPINVKKVLRLEAELNHDLAAFLEERKHWLPTRLQKFFHRRMTSYDTEESAFVQSLRLSAERILHDMTPLFGHISKQAERYKFTPMNGRTHGQEAEMQSFGKRCLTWYQDLKTAIAGVRDTMANLRFSKLSGAIGTNSGIDPKLEKGALRALGFEPYFGATQILPRVLFAPLANALANLALVLSKVADDTRLMGRSGRPLCHEPFGKKQKGSSAMPHKKNNILGENTASMAKMAKHYAAGIQDVIKTWEERDISQSALERVFWPDLFHVTLRAIKNVTKFMSGLVVYPDNMAIEIIESRGSYASNEAKELLSEIGENFGLKTDDAYRIVQLACFNAFEPDSLRKRTRCSPPLSLGEADELVFSISGHVGSKLSALPSIQDIIADAKLQPSEQLEASAFKVVKWNAKLRRIFRDGGTRTKWHAIFRPSHILANEQHLFEKVLAQN